MLVTVSGTVTLVMAYLPANAEFEMLVTGKPLVDAGMTTAPPMEE